MAEVATSAPAQSTVAPASKSGGLTDRAKSERKLAYMLCAPAVIVMLLVAGFPIVYAFWLSLRRAGPALPGRREVRGPAQLHRRARLGHVVDRRRQHADHHGRSP